MRPAGLITRSPLAACAFFLLLSLAAYVNAVNHPFVHDDVVFILNNPDIRDLNPVRVFQPKSIPGPSAGLINVYYRPLIEAYYRLAFAVFGEQAWGFHLINILLHGLNGFLLFRLFTRARWLPPESALFAASLFVVHPVQTEAVACISGISNLFLLAVMLGCLLLYLKGREAGRRTALAGSVALMLTGCLVKEQMIVVPVLVFLYEALLAAKGERRWRACGVLFAALGGYFVLRRLLLGMTVTGIFDARGEYMLRFLAIPRSLLGYIQIILWPGGLHYYRSLDVLEPNTAAWIVLTVLTGILGAVVWKTPAEPRRTVLFGLGWFGVTLLPMLNIVPLVNEYSTILNFEHFVYIPMIGLIAALTVLFTAWVKPRLPAGARAVPAAAVVLTVLCLPLTWRQNTYWRSEVALFSRALRYEESGRLRMLLAKALYFRGQYPEAIAQYERSLGIMQGYADKTPLPEVRQFYRGFIKGIYFDLAHCYEALQNPATAIRMYDQALTIDPRDIVLYNNLAVVYIKEKNFAAAAGLLEKALAIDGRSALTRQNLAYTYVQLGRQAEADALFGIGKDAHHE